MGTSSVKRTCSINDKCNLPLSPKFQFNENEIRLKFFTKISLKWRCHVRKSSKIMKSHEFVIPMNLWKLSKKQVLVSSKSNHSKMIIGTQFHINCFNILNERTIAPSKVGFWSLVKILFVCLFRGKYYLRVTPYRNLNIWIPVNLWFWKTGMQIFVFH